MTILRVLAVCFLLAGSIAEGGESWHTDEHGRKVHKMWYDGDSTRFNPDTLRHVQEVPMVNLVILLRAWDAYLAECKADSHEVKGHLFRGPGNKTYRQQEDPDAPMIDPGFNPGYLGKTTWVEHREPTLEGFMEFIRTKAKE